VRICSTQWCYAALCLVATSSAVAQDETLADARYLSYAGQAFDIDSGDKIYGEVHQVKSVDGQPLERIVTYRCPNGAAFARKRVQRSRLASAPQFSMEDHRLDYDEGLEVSNDDLVVYVRGVGDTQRKSEILAELPDDLVADAGFDVFVLDRWERLVAGETVHFHFLVPSRLEYMNFKVKQVREERIGEREARTFRLALGGLLGLIVSGIDVSYDAETRTILQFSGLSNVRDPDGKNYVVRLDFPPAERIEQSGPAAFDAAGQEALVKTCTAPAAQASEA